MSDLISREAALGAIKSYCNGCDNYNGVRCGSCLIDNAIIAVDAVPVVDAFPVTRCKDCVFMGHPIVAKDFRKDAGWCMSHGHIVLPNDFCSDAEPMEDEDE